MDDNFISNQMGYAYPQSNPNNNSSMLGLLGSIFSGLSGIGGAIGNYYSNKNAIEANRQSVAQTNATNLQIARETNDANYRLWQEQTAYNTPANQMARLKEAGLNPNLMYGNGSASANASPAPTMQMAHTMPFTGNKNTFGELAQGVNSAIQSFNEQRIINADVKLKNSQADAIKAKTALDNANTMLAISKDEKLKSEIPYLSEFFAQRNVLQGYQTDKEAEQVNNLRIQANLLVADTDFRHAMIEQTKQNTEYIKKQQNVSDAQANYLAKQVDYLSGMITLNHAKYVGISLDNALKSATFQDNVRLVSAQLTKLIADGAQSSFIADFLKTNGFKPGTPIYSAITSWITKLFNDIGNSSSGQYPFQYSPIMPIL